MPSTSRLTVTTPALRSSLALNGLAPISLASGALSTDQMKMISSPSGSYEPVPSNVSGAPMAASPPAPARATGAVLFSAVEMRFVLGVSGSVHWVTIGASTRRAAPARKPGVRERREWFMLRSVPRNRCRCT